MGKYVGPSGMGNEIGGCPEKIFDDMVAKLNKCYLECCAEIGENFVWTPAIEEGMGVGRNDALKSCTDALAECIDF